MTEKRKPSLDETLASESSKGFSEICKLPDRMQRYSDAKGRQVQILNHVRRISQGQNDIPLHGFLDFEKLKSQLCGCGNYLVFHQYHTVGQVRLAKASFCKNHLMCQLCAIRRGAKQVQSYLDKFEQITESNPNLKPYLVTLTVRNGHDLAERFGHLQDSLKKMFKRRRNFIEKARGQSELAKAEGGVYSIELTKRETGWHPHVHMVLMLDPSNPIDFPFDARPYKYPPEEWRSLTPAQKANEKRKNIHFGELAKQSALSKEWQKITGDSFVVDVRPIEGDPAQGFVEVFKYALKFSDLTPEQNIEAYSFLKGKRLTGSFGCFWGVKVPEKMTDDLFSDLPYIELFYKYTKAGYSLQSAEPKTVQTYSKEDKVLLSKANPQQLRISKINSPLHSNRYLRSIIQSVAEIHTHKEFIFSEGLARERAEPERRE